MNSVNWTRSALLAMTALAATTSQALAEMEGALPCNALCRAYLGRSEPAAPAPVAPPPYDREPGSRQKPERTRARLSPVQEQPVRRSATRLQAIGRPVATKQPPVTVSRPANLVTRPDDEKSPAARSPIPHVAASPAIQPQAALPPARPERTVPEPPVADAERGTAQASGHAGGREEESSGAAKAALVGQASYDVGVSVMPVGLYAVRHPLPLADTMSPEDEACFAQRSRAVIAKYRASLAALGGDDEVLREARRALGEYADSVQDLERRLGPFVANYLPCSTKG